MCIEQARRPANAPTSVMLPAASPRPVASCEHEIVERRNTEACLRGEISHYQDLLRQKDAFIDEQILISQESNHRLLNDLQIVASLLSLQSRKSANAEAASQLTAAASRVATIARVHQRLHSMDGAQSLSLKKYLVDFCRDFSTLLGTDQAIAVEGIEILVPRAIAHSA